MSKRCHLAKGTRQFHAGGGGFRDGKEDAMKPYKVGKPKGWYHFSGKFAARERGGFHFH